jgi:hypothetical protein
MDFLWATDAKEKVWDHIFDQLESIWGT